MIFLNPNMTNEIKNCCKKCIGTPFKGNPTCYAMFTDCCHKSEPMTEIDTILKEKHAL